MDKFLNIVRESADGALNGVSDGIIVAMAIIIGLLVIVSIVALVISIMLSIKYVKYNRKQVACGKTGEAIAREVLDRNELQNIRVSSTGSIMFGNSYSHYFKKVRLRRLTWKKTSVTSMSIAVQKSALAILDKENDPDMRVRVRLTPIIYFGPLAFVPLVIIGALLDTIIFKTQTGTYTIACSIAGLLIYIVSFIMSLYVLKTEKKAQQRALRIMKDEGIATSEEVEMSRALFKLYNIEYVNNMIIALLELIYRVLQIIAYIQNTSSSSKNS